MITQRSYLDQIWIDLNSPTKEEVDSLVLSQNLDPSVAKDLLSPTPKQYAKEYENIVYAVIHIPVFKHSRTNSVEQEIDLCMSPKSIITTRYESIDALHHFGKRMEVDEILNKEMNHSHIIFGMMREIYGFLFNEVEYLKDWMGEIEKNIFEGHERDMVFAISSVSRNLLNFKRILDPHKAVWLNIENMHLENFGSRFKKDTRLLIEELERLMLEIENISNMLDEVRETNNSILTTKQNEIMKNLSILAFVVIPLATISQIFSMGARYTPIIGLKHDFWIMIAIMVFTSLAMFVYFKYKKWI